MTRQGPKYLLCGSRLTSDTLILRAILTGLNSQAREWQEVIIIEDNGTLEGLENEVDDFRHLQHRRVEGWSDPNVIIAFMDRLSQNRETAQLLIAADRHSRPAFIVSTYQGESGRILP